MRWGRRRLTPRPLWIPAFAGMTLGCAGRRVLLVAEGEGVLPARHRPPAGPAAPRSPFDFPQGERPPGPRMALSVWVPARAGMARVGGPLRVPSGQASTGSGRTELGSASMTGSRGCDGGRRRPRRAPALGSRVRGNDGGGSRRFEGGLGGGAPPGAPLDSCLRRNDEVCRRYDEVCGCGGIDVAGSEVCRRARLVRGSRRGCARPVPWRLRLALGRPRCRWGGRRPFDAASSAAWLRDCAARSASMSGISRPRPSTTRTRKLK